MTTSEKSDKVEDVEMKDDTEKETEKKDPNLLSVEDIREHCKLIRRSVETKETRFGHLVFNHLEKHFHSIYTCLSLPFVVVVNN